jgi:Bacterial PH domain
MSAQLEGSDYKPCPDCAERVLARARKCRYCGYRFDGGRHAQGSRLSDLLFTRLAGASIPTLPDVLADWGINLSDGEHVAYFRVAAMDGRPGYLLVTSERLVFFEHTWGRGHHLTVEHSLSDLTVQVKRRILNRRLELHARDFRHVLDELQGKEVGRIASYIAKQRQATQRIQRG